MRGFSVTPVLYTPVPAAQSPAGAGSLFSAEADTAMRQLVSGSSIYGSPFGASSPNTDWSYSFLVSGSDKGPQNGGLHPASWSYGNTRTPTTYQGGPVLPVTAVGQYILYLDTCLGETGSRSVTASTFASTNTVAGTHYDTISNTVTVTDGMSGKFKALVINVKSLPTGFGLIGVSITGANAYRGVAWLWVQNPTPARVPGARFMITSNGANVGGNTAGSGTLGSPWQSLQFAVSQMSTLGLNPNVLYVQKSGTHTEWSGTAGLSDGPHIVGSYPNSNPLIILPDPFNAGVVLFDQGSTAGGSNPLFSNANGPTFPTNSTGSGVWICGMRFTRGNIYFYFDVNNWTDCVIWQCEVDNYASSGSNVHCIRCDHTTGLIIQDCHIYKAWSTESGKNSNSYFPSILAGFESCIGGLYPANLTIAHCLLEYGQYGFIYKQGSNTPNTGPKMTHCVVRFCESSGGTGGGLLAGFPVQGAAIGQCLISYNVYDGANDNLAGGGVLYAPGGLTGQSAYLDIVNNIIIAPPSLGGGGVGVIASITNVRVFNLVSQDCTSLDMEFKLHVPDAGQSTKMDSYDHTLWVRSVGQTQIAYGGSSTTYNSLAQLQAAPTGAYFANPMAQSSTLTSTTPSYGNTASFNYRFADSAGLGGRARGVADEFTGIVNNFMNPNLPVTT